jgi:hypothetical protein
MAGRSNDEAAGFIFEESKSWSLLMAKTLYCWRCRTDAAMLDEHEWESVRALLVKRLEQIMELRQAHGMSLEEATRASDDTPALVLYGRLTGFQANSVDALWHHRLSLFGPPCPACGRPLRTPRATRCVECGAKVVGDDGLEPPTSSV